MKTTRIAVHPAHEYLP